MEQHSAATRAQPVPARPAADSPDRPGTLVDRTGARDALVRYLNQDFIPLARECIAQAHGRSPELRGMLALGVETLAADELGAVVEKAEFAARNEVHDPELLECIRETALSVTFPPPLVTGREQFELTLRVAPVNDASPSAGPGSAPR